ncbi:MAG: hypothetical protein Q9160_002831 [Pyrenula sp. 1 TL-2023]
MLPTAKSYLISGGYSPRLASYALIGLFLAGVVGIQVLSRVMHHFMPSHIVDCDHSHDEDVEPGKDEMEEPEHNHNHNHNHANGHGGPLFKVTRFEDATNEEERPLLSSHYTHDGVRSTSVPAPTTASQDNFITAPSSRRQSVMPRGLTRTLTALASGKKATCDETGPCKGYSDPCGQECFKAASRRESLISPLARVPSSGRLRATTNTLQIVSPVEEVDDEYFNPNASNAQSPREDDSSIGRSRTSTEERPPPISRSRSTTHHFHHPSREHPFIRGKPRRYSSVISTGSSNDGPLPPLRRRRSSSFGHATEAHHHHVPSNAFMSIGLQTSIAIALHKVPEGFITYATNHANPTLGFAVFMALFIHNITEGFALALPLYLALRSRAKAITWASILGGVSQPLGAGIAALWFKIASGRGPMSEPGERVYGGMFAVTAGVMTSVALQLFSESLTLTHNRNLCIGFAFLGMGILGFSFALTA